MVQHSLNFIPGIICYFDGALVYLLFKIFHELVYMITKRNKLLTTNTINSKVRPEARQSVQKILYRFPHNLYRVYSFSIEVCVIGPDQQRAPLRHVATGLTKRHVNFSVWYTKVKVSLFIPHSIPVSVIGA